MPRAMCAHLLANIFHNVYYLVIGLQKLWNPAIPDGKTWSKFGEHGEHGKDGKHQPDDLKQSIYYSKHPICDSKHSICQQDDSKHSSLRNL